MRDETPAAATPDSSIPPYVPAEAHGDMRGVLRTPWVRRWSLIVMLLMFAWTAAAWQLNTRRYHQRLEGIVQSATSQALASEVLVEDGLRQGLAQLDGVAHMLTRLPSVRRGVVAAGLGSTDLLYYASGSLGVPGAMITASHNPSKYNGIKLCRAGARPVGADSGLTELREAAARGVPAHEGRPGAVRC